MKHHHRSYCGLLTHQESRRGTLQISLDFESKSPRFRLRRSFHSAKGKRVEFDIWIKQLYLDFSLYDTLNLSVRGSVHVSAPCRLVAFDTTVGYVKMLRLDNLIHFIYGFSVLV